MNISFLPFFAAAERIATTWDSPEVILLKLLAILVLVLLNGFFVASEFAIVKVRSSQLDAMIDQGTRSAIHARHAVSHLDAYLSATQLGITLASLGLGWLGEPFLAAMIEPAFAYVGIQKAAVIHSISFMFAFGIITFLHIVLGELAPKSLAIRKALQTTLFVARPLGFFHTLFRPFIWFLNGAANELLRRVFKLEPVAELELVHSEEELRLILSESQKSNEVSSVGRELVIAALDLKHRVARDIMTPRGEVVFLDLDKPFEISLETALKSQHTRFPLCRGHLDDAIGQIHIKDLLTCVRSGNTDMISIRRELLHVSEMMPLEKLLKFLLNKRAHLVVAVDEFGGAVGVITLENVLEELVGEIEDEFDETPDNDELHRISENEFEIEGSMPLYEMEEAAGLKLESSEVSTIGGYVTHLLGHLPAEGETVMIDGYDVTVVKSDGRRIARLKFRRDPNRAHQKDNGPADPDIRKI